MANEGKEVEKETKDERSGGAPGYAARTFQFKEHGREWDCKYVKEGERIDEAAFESSTGRITKVKCFEIVGSQQNDWKEITGKRGCGIIFAADCCPA